jgi:hypothetical protein
MRRQSEECLWIQNEHAVPHSGYGVFSSGEAGREHWDPPGAGVAIAESGFPGQDCFRMPPSSSTMAVISLMLKVAFFCTMLYRYSRSS